MKKRDMCISLAVILILSAAAAAVYVIGPAYGGKNMTSCTSGAVWGRSDLITVPEIVSGASVPGENENEGNVKDAADTCKKEDEQVPDLIFSENETAETADDPEEEEIILPEDRVEKTDKTGTENDMDMKNNESSEKENRVNEKEKENENTEADGNIENGTAAEHLKNKTEGESGPAGGTEITGEGNNGNTAGDNSPAYSDQGTRPFQGPSDIGKNETDTDDISDSGEIRPGDGIKF